MASLEIISPLELLISWPAKVANSTSKNIKDFFMTYRDNTALRTEVASLRTLQDTVFKLQAENEQLQSILMVRPAEGTKYITARITAMPSHGASKNIVINAGTETGVFNDATVFTPDGLVGRVIEAGTNTSRVMLITDLMSRIPVIIEPSHKRAILSGTNKNQMHLLHFDSDFKPQIGERVFTSGQGGIFKAGIPIGIVASVIEEQIELRPLADLAAADFVNVTVEEAAND